MSSLTQSLTSNKGKTSILEKPLSRGKYDISVGAFAFLFCEMVHYCQGRVYTVPELQTKLSELGNHVGMRILDWIHARERNFKRETKLLNVLLMIKSTVWKTLFGKEADKLEHAIDDEKTYYIIEEESLTNKFISVPKETGSLNCAAFIAGILESILIGCNFPAKVTVHWHKGTTFMIKFEDSVISRDRGLEGR